MIAGNRTQSLVGGQIGHYRVLSLLGAGGMGEVYRACDIKLGRDVAIKVLPASFAHDPDRVRLFEREAQVLAALNHAHIAAIYGLEEADGICGLVLELVDGPALAERLASGPLSVDEALSFAGQIAVALEAAHEKGIVHRDLKPANIKITNKGVVKVLDFGLARMFAGEAEGVDLSQAATLTAAGTRKGTVLGTPAYMSPEQARGKPLDKRIDIWSFGCVLYEMLSGKAAFAGETISDTIAAILGSEPDWETLPATVPAAIQRLLRRCLAKDSARRLHDIADARIEIEEALTAPAPTTGPKSPTAIGRRFTWRRLGPYALLLLVMGAIVGWSLRPAPSPAPRPVARMLIGVEPAEQFGRPRLTAVALSPDGHDLVFSAARGGREQLYLRALDQLEAQPISGTEGGVAPFFCPDGKWVGFWANRKLEQVPVTGGPPVVLCDAPQRLAPFGASWASDDTIVYAERGEGLWQVSAAGGTPRALTKVDIKKGEFDHILPQMLPGGKAVLFTVRTSGVWDEARIVVQALKTGDRRTLIEGGTDARYVPSGHLIYMKSGTLMAVPFDLARLQTRGAPVAIIEGIMQSIGMLAPSGDTGAGQFSISDSGILVYVLGNVRPAAEASLVWVDRKGVVQPLAAPTREYLAPRLSPDGRQLAVRIRQELNEDLWVYDILRETLTRLTFKGRNYAPVWSPDGKRIVFNSDANGQLNLFWMPADGSGEPERLTTSDNRQDPSSWSPDGREIVFTERYPPTRELRILSMKGMRQSRPYLQTQFQHQFPEFSPDGRWLAYSSNESGTFEVYVQAYPGPGERQQISAGGGTEPLWNRNGHEIFYRDGNKVMAADITTVPSFRAGKGRLLFEGPYARSVPVRSYDIAADGRRFLMVLPAEKKMSEPPTQVTIVLN